MHQKQEHPPLSLHQLRLTQERIDYLLSQKYLHDRSYIIFPTVQGVITLKSIILGKGLPFPGAKQYLVGIKNGQ